MPRRPSNIPGPAAAAVLALACAACCANADELFWRGVLYAELADVTFADGQVRFRLPSGALLARPEGEVQELRLARADTFNQAEQAALAARHEEAAALYAAALAAEGPSPRRTLMEAREKRNRQAVDALTAQRTRQRHQLRARVSLDAFAAAPADAGHWVLWRLAIAEVGPPGLDSLVPLTGVSPGGSRATFAVSPAAVKAMNLEPGLPVNVVARVEAVERPASAPAGAGVTVRLANPIVRPAVAEVQAGGGTDVVFLLDSSGSMIVCYDRVVEELVEAILALGPKDRLAVVPVGQSPSPAAGGGLTPAQPEFRMMWLQYVLEGEGARASGPDRGVAALADARRLLPGEGVSNRPRTIWLFSDGTLTAPDSLLRAVADKAAWGGVRVDCRAYAADKEGLALLRALSTLTGGQFTQAPAD